MDPRTNWTLVGSIRSALAMSVHPTYFDQATPLLHNNYVITIPHVYPKYFGPGVSMLTSTSDSTSSRITGVHETIK